MKQKIIEIINMVQWVIFVFIFFCLGIYVSRKDIRYNELQKRYAYTDNELDQCVKMNLELRREK